MRIFVKLELRLNNPPLVFRYRPSSENNRLLGTIRGQLPILNICFQAPVKAGLRYHMKLMQGPCYLVRRIQHWPNIECLFPGRGHMKLIQGPCHPVRRLQQRVKDATAVALERLFPVVASQSRTVLSHEADARTLPSGEKATALTQSLWPSSVCRQQFQPSLMSITFFMNSLFFKYCLGGFSLHSSSD